MIVTARPYADLLEHDGEALLLTEGTLVRLSGVGATVVRLATGGIDAEDLAAALEDAFGRPPAGTAMDALRPILDSLAAQHLVELSPGPDADLEAGA